jgi:hypothetical protein
MIMKKILKRIFLIFIKINLVIIHPLYGFSTEFRESAILNHQIPLISQLSNIQHFQGQQKIQRSASLGVEDIEKECELVSNEEKNVCLFNQCELKGSILEKRNCRERVVSIIQINATQEIDIRINELGKGAMGLGAV